MKHGFALLILLLLLSLNGWAQVPNDPGTTIFEIPQLAETVVIDGSLDDAVWLKACEIRDFFQLEQSLTGQRDGRAFMFRDADNLYVGLDMPAFKSDRTPPVCYLSEEPDLRQFPHVSISLDPDHGHGVYYTFLLDSEGRRQDLRVDDESWHMDWRAVSRLEKGRFRAEVSIPLARFNTAGEGKIWGFNLTLNEIVSGGMVHSSPMGLRYADAANFGQLLFTGDLSKQAIQQIRSSLPGIHRNMVQERLESNRIHCGPDLVEIPNEIPGLAAGERIQLKNGNLLTCLGLDNDPLVRSDYPFFYEKYENPELQRLRKQYNLQEIISSGKNDFEQILLLNEWLVEHVPFGSPPPIRPQALQVLYHGLNGQTFYCTYLSFTLMQMYCSLGFTARKITSVGHGTLDVWSDYWGKWMQIDPSRNSYFRMAGTAVPLNSNEIRREFHRNRGIDMEMVFGTEQRAERVTLEKREDGHYQYRQDGYEWIAYKSRNNFFEVPFAYWNYEYLIPEDEYNREKKWESQGKQDVRDVLGTRTARVEDIFWTLNQAHIHLYDQGTDELRVQLETHCPNFSGFEVSIDKGEWEPADPLFSWSLHEGQNFLKARSLNKFGVRGKEHKMVLYKAN